MGGNSSRFDPRLVIVGGIVAFVIIGLAVRALVGPGPLSGARINRGLAHGLRGEREAACRELQEAVRRSPDDAGAWLRAGRALARVGRGSEAVSSLQRAVELAPHSADAHYQLAKVLIAEGRLEEAAQELIAVQTARPGHADGLYLASGVAAARGETEAALELLDSALGASPSHPGRYRWDPLFDPLRHDDRFLRIVRRHGPRGLFAEEDS